MKQFKLILTMLLLLLFSTSASAQADKIQLLWANAEDAVMYELEIASVPFNNTKKSAGKHIVYQTTDIFTPGTELNLVKLSDQKLNKLYYRVRPLNLDKQPIADFSKPVLVSKGQLNPTKPTATSFFSKNRPAPLYPVYSWIPVLGAARYEVEITDEQPENPNDIEPSEHRVRSYTVEGGFDCYDTHAYTEPGTYYWRVLAYDEGGHPIGTYSNAIPFKVQTTGIKWAVFGDSITHGGGAISNPPSDRRFDYSAYLPFPVKNLGLSGDTAEMLVNRFTSDVLPFQPRYLLILGGTNSIRGGVSAESVIASLTTIKDMCTDNGITPIFLTLPPVNPERIQRVFNEPTAANWQTELAEVNNFIRSQPLYIDIYPALADANGILPVEYAEDGLHPDIAGKRIMGRTINSFLKKHHFD